MDPQLKSWLTTAAVAVVVCGGTLAVDHGIITQTDSEAIITAVITIAGAGSLAQYKARQVSPAGLVNAMSNTNPAAIAQAVSKTDPDTLIKVVNEDPNNGVKVVAATSKAVAVDRALK